MRFDGLFLSARVLRATYQIVSTTLLLFYIANRVAQKRDPIPRQHERIDYLFRHQQRRNLGAWTRHDMEP